MTLRLNPYLNFRDQAREALEFYQAALGGDLTISTFGDAGASNDPADADKVMHGQLDVPGGLTIMAGDTPSSMPDPQMGTAINISLNGDDPALRHHWEKLSEGAEIVEPFEQAPWGDTFGILNDRFGVAWLVNLTGTPTDTADIPV